MKRILVVTGSSRGIGAATARLAAQRGYAVCVNYTHNQIAARSVADEIKEEGGQAIAVACDISSEPEVVRLFESVDKAFGRVTDLVNNAGVLERQVRVEEMDAAVEWRRSPMRFYGYFQMRLHIQPARLSMWREADE